MSYSGATAAGFGIVTQFFLSVVPGMGFDAYALFNFATLGSVLGYNLYQSREV